MGLCCLPDPPTVFGTNLTCLSMPRFVLILSNMQKYFVKLCLIFILSENKDFHSGVFLKMPPSSPSMEEFDLDIQK